LPKLATGEWIGCFGLTEPDAGSDPQAMRTKAEQAKCGYRLTGTKTWITNSPVADICIVWAKSSADQGRIRGFILERGMPGLTTPTISQKLSLRASPTGMDGVAVPEENVLPSAIRLKAPFGCLNHARFGICWGRWARPKPVSKPRGPTRWNGASLAGRSRPTSSFKKSLPICKPKLCWAFRRRIGRLLDAGKLAPEAISLDKRNNAGKALDIARMARDMFGAGGRSFPGHAPPHQSRNGKYLRGDTRYPRAYPRPRDYWPAGVFLATRGETYCELTTKIDLYYWTNPSGHKITLFLEETGLHPVDLNRGNQFNPEVLAISPDNSIPAIVDHPPSDVGAPVSVFESGHDPLISC
jgi:hypothetical protein